MAFAVFGTCVDTPSFGELRGLEGPSLLVVSDGCIQAVHRGVAAEEHRKTLESEGISVRSLKTSEILVPGFIDTHIHFPQFPFTGAGIDKPLMGEDGFLTKYAFPTEESMSNLDTARSVYSAALDTLLCHGTTSALIFASIHAEASKELVDAALEKRGPRAFVGKVCVDRYCPDSYIETTEASLKETEDFIKYTQARAVERCQSPPYLVQPVVTPRFLPTCTPELLSGLGQLAARYNCMIQSHMSESIDEVEFASQLFEGKSDAEVFAHSGLLRPASVMAHCVQMNHLEAELLKTSGAAIAHCPLSNFFFANGALPVKELKGRGLKIGLGTDVAGGYSPSMLSAMRAAVLASKTRHFHYLPGTVGANSTVPHVEKGLELEDLNHFHALYLATMGGAESLALEDLLGSFEKGKRFDAVLLSQASTAKAFVGDNDSKEDLLQKIITLGDDRNVQEVFVDGRLVYSQVWVPKMFVMAMKQPWLSKPAINCVSWEKLS